MICMSQKGLLYDLHESKGAHVVGPLCARLSSLERPDFCCTVYMNQKVQMDFFGTFDEGF